MTFRIYRLPGSREFWLIDSGAGTPVIKVLTWKAQPPTKSVEVGAEANPRAWIEVTGHCYIQSRYTEAVFVTPKTIEEKPQ